jgi:hypothetical protein
MWLRFDGGAASAAQPSLQIAAGALYEMPPNGVRRNAISVFCATTGKGFSSVEW